MATKQIWTLDPVLYPDLTSENTADDILCPTIRVAKVTDRHTPVWKQGQMQFIVTPHHNSDHDDFVNWLKIENHKRKGSKQPTLEANKEAAELFLIAHPVYKTKRGLRHRLKTA